MADATGHDSRQRLGRLRVVVRPRELDRERSQADLHVDPLGVQMLERLVADALQWLHHRLFCGNVAVVTSGAIAAHS